MSLGVGICVCALLVPEGLASLSDTRRSRWRWSFFGLLYRDERILNAIEDRMQGAVAQLAPGERVVSGVEDHYLRVFA